MTSDTYNILYKVFLIIGIVLAVFAVVLFFVFDIRKILSVKTGMAMRKSLKELNEINTNSDRKHRKIKKAKSVPLYEDGSHEQRQEGSVNINAKAQTINATVNLNKLKNETIVLGNEEKEQNTVTQVTETLENSFVEPAAEVQWAMDESKKPVGMFNITETKVVIFSDEIIGG